MSFDQGEFEEIMQPWHFMVSGESVHGGEEDEESEIWDSRTIMVVVQWMSKCGEVKMKQ